MNPSPQTLDPKWTAESIRAVFHDGLAKTLDVEVAAVHPDGITAEVVVSAKHLRPGGIANGGLALTLLETLGSVSACCVVDFTKFNVFGTSVSANHFKPATVGQRLNARSKSVHLGRSTQVWDVTITNESGQLVSGGRITLLVLPRKE